MRDKHNYPEPSWVNDLPPIRATYKMIFNYILEDGNESPVKISYDLVQTGPHNQIDIKYPLEDIEPDSMEDQLRDHFKDVYGWDNTDITFTQL